MEKIIKEKIHDIKKLNTFHLKLIAVISMTIDHIGVVFLPQYYFLRIIGRISFPVICFLLVNGILHTRNIGKYMARIGAMALISEVLFDKAFYGQIYYPIKQNALFTLLIGAAMLGVVEFLRKNILTEEIVINYVLEGVIVILACGLAYYLRSDYRFYGILMMYWFYVFRFNKILMGLFVAYTNLELLGGVQIYAVFSLIPIYLYNGEKGYNKCKWWFYAYFPIHLFMICIINAAV